jgi:hypothetical protein
METTRSSSSLNSALRMNDSAAGGQGVKGSSEDYERRRTSADVVGSLLLSFPSRTARSCCGFFALRSCSFPSLLSSHFTLSHSTNALPVRPTASISDSPAQLTLFPLPIFSLRSPPKTSSFSSLTTFTAN